MAKSRIIISGYLEDEYIGIKRKERGDKLERIERCEVFPEEILAPWWGD